MKLFSMLAGAVVAAGIAIAMSGTASAAEPKCGLSNGKAASGAPIEIGAVVGAPARPTSAARLRPPPRFQMRQCQWRHQRPPCSLRRGRRSVESGNRFAGRCQAGDDTKVVGMVGSSSFVECAANAKFYETNNVLSITGVGVPRDCFHSKNIAPTNGGPRMSNIGAAQYMHDVLGVKRMVCIAPNIPNTGDWSCYGVEAYGKQVGMEVKTILTDPASTDGHFGDLGSDDLQSAGHRLQYAERKSVSRCMPPPSSSSWAARCTSPPPTSHYDDSLPKAIGPYWNKAAGCSSSSNSSPSISTAAMSIIGMRCSTSTAARATSGTPSRRPDTWPPMLRPKLY